MRFMIGLAVFGGIALAIIAFALRQRRRERRTAAWPWAKISLDSDEIENVGYGDGGSDWELTVEYSYTVEGQRYSGTYTASLASESEAEDLLKNLRELPPPVRYQPGKPEVSVLEPYRDAALGL
jgi:cbb3-type cytochrome oxidase subunit 3